MIFSDDPALLKASKKQQRGLMTRDRVGLDHNWATLALVKDGGRPSLHPVFMLSPLREGFFQATITDFVIDPDSEQPGVVLNFTHNYFNVLFFSI
ncbi:MAG: hypothetical protein HUK40_09895 [Desulfobacter sp.]|nr:hypothetical protein [Desulfobacter sp.]WDP84369.1 MAG: hypothetical protein HUN05_03735 [Desulfobacter sp.]